MCGKYYILYIVRAIIPYIVFARMRGRFLMFDFIKSDSYPEFAKNAQVIIICMFIGVAAAALISLYHKHVLGSFVRFLLESGAKDEGSAIKLNTTKYNKNFFVRAAINNGRTYSAVLRSVLPEGAPDLSKLPAKEKRRAKSEILSGSGYYIPEELTFRADNMLSKKGTSVVSALLGVLLFLIIAAVSLMVVPQIVDMFKNFTGLQ